MRWNSRRVCLAATGLVSLLFLVTPAPARAGSCDSAATVASDVWANYRKATELLGCRTPLGGAAEYALCSATRLVNETTEDAVGWWNSVAQNRWATIGPRILGAEIEFGTVIAPTKRTFVSLVPSFNDGKIVVRGKQGTGVVTICAVDQAGKQYKLFNDEQVQGDRTFNISRKDAEGRVLSVVIESKPVSFQYEIQKTEVPVEWNYGPVKGLADLHVHMAAELGFAGLWLRGNHDGPQNEALKSCRPLDLRDPASLAAQLKGLPVPEKQKLHAIPLNWNKHEDEEVVIHGNGHAAGADAFKDWPHFSDIAHQQVHAEWLREAHRKGLKLVVVSAVNNELLCRVLRAALYQGDNKYACEDMSNLHRQLDAYNALDQRHDWLEIALTPWHARRIIHQGKLAVVLSAESSHLMPPSEGDFKAQLDKMHQKGLRALQIVHERDNRFSGAAPHRPNFWWHQRTSNPFAWVTTMGDDSPFSLDAAGKNTRGLSPDGEQLIDAMVQRRMLIDVSHYSERAFDRLYELVTTKYDRYPFHASHTRLAGVLEDDELKLLKEFLTTNPQVTKLKAVGGMVGLRTGANHIKTYAPSGVPNDCPGSSKSYAQMVAFARDQGLPVAFGSDFNGVTQQLGPRVGNESCYAARNANRGVSAWNKDQKPVAGAVARYETQGLKHVGYLPDLYTDLQALKTSGADRLNDGAEAFIKMWEKTYGSDTPVTVNSANQCQADRDCAPTQYCDAGVDLKANACRAKKDDGESCALVDGGRTCKSGTCKVGRCYTARSKDIGQTCFIGDECRAGKCNNAVDGKQGTCVCAEDSDCGADRWCDGGADLKVNACKRKLDKGEVCGKVGDLNVGHRCKSGKCKVSGLSTKLECQ